MSLSLREEKDRIDFHRSLMDATCNWWATLYQQKAAKFVYLSEKLSNKYSEEDEAEFNSLHEQIQQLEKKRDWEVKELTKLEQRKQAFEKRAENDFKVNLKSTLVRKIRHKGLTN